MIFYKTAQGNLIQDNYHVKAYEQENAEVAGFSYWDQSGNGNWDLIILVEFSGSIVITPVSMVVSATSKKARFSESTSNTYLNTDYVATTMFSPSQLLVIGCDSCRSN